MLLQLPLLLLMLLLILPSPSSSLPAIAKPGCPNQCGNIWISYPFGVGSGCSMEPSFDIICNDSTYPPRAYLSHINTELIQITPFEVRVKFPNLILSSYRSRAGNKSDTPTPYNLSQTRYMFSDDNWLTAIGCDDMATVTGQANRSFGGGCVSYCLNKDDSGNVASCPDDTNEYGIGFGCCRSPIPKGTTILSIDLHDVHTQWRNRKFFSNSYAFIGEKPTTSNNTYSYILSDLDNATIFDSDDWVDKNTPSVLLDWSIASKNCDQALKDPTTYACHSHADCKNFDNNSNSNVGGYFCLCSTGYEGNPYLTNGCQDINECANDTSPCHPKAQCINTPGKFNCRCRNGYSGNGLIDGDDNGCVRRPPYKLIYPLAGLVGGLGFILVVLATYSRLRKVWQKRNKRKKKEKIFESLLLQHRTNEGTLERTKLFHAKELEKATDHFNKSRIVGEGGQGTVYKGMLSDGKIVAIKKLKFVGDDQFEQLINEVVILSQINHRNVVKLFGCCLETEVPLLVYEFVPNGTLFDLIHDPRVEFPFHWKMRLKIAADIAGALAYLHSASSIPIYHRDIKSSNILLDDKFVVKVSDFGTSKVVGVDQTHLTTMVKGTFGYLDPEYFLSSMFTEKSDVYSFGVVLAELLTGKRPITLERREKGENLATLFIEYMEGNILDIILDAKVIEHSEKEEVIAMARLAERCLNQKGKMRPTMREVATELESIRISQKASTRKDGSREATYSYEKAKLTMISDNEYSWTGNGKSKMSSLSSTSSSSDMSPFMFDKI